MIEIESNMSSEYVGSIRNMRSMRRRNVPGPLWDVLTPANINESVVEVCRLR